MGRKRYIIYVFIAIIAHGNTSKLVAQPATSKEGSLHGIFYDEHHTPLQGVIVQLRGAEIYETTTGMGGLFHFPAVALGKHMLFGRYIGFEDVEIPVELTIFEKHRDLKITLIPSRNVLEDVLIRGKSETQTARELPIRAVVVDVKKVADQPTSLAELMNRSTGIRMRQSGGIGTAVDMSINGFQGNSVQYFKDGIPLEYLGGGYAINNIPVNLLDRVEVFKGVVPISLGGDALGGAVNLVTEHHQHDHLHASYEAASFNTHLSNVSLYKQIRTHSFVGVEGFYNYSDNDYKAEVQVVNEHANPVTAKVSLFHNGYKQHFTELYGGIKNTSWADQLKISLAHYGIAKETQHPALMTNPYGALMTHNTGWVPSIRYQKTWLEHDIGFDQFLSYSAIDRSRIDTIHGTFDWYGEFIPRPEMGESPRRSFAQLHFDNLMSRTIASMAISDKHQIEGSLVLNINKRIGSDPYGLRFQDTDIDVLSKKSTYRKMVAGATWESTWLNELLTNQLSVKYFHYASKGINGFMANSTALDQYISRNNTNWGIGNAVKYQIGPRSFVRASFELTNRLPREMELFGDNDTRAPNFDLAPERSFNVNLGYAYQGARWSVETGGFYRKTQGMILLVPVQPPFAQYQNLDSIRGYGFDVDVSYRLAKNWNMTANSTWQDNRMIDIADPIHQWMEGTRLRNTPYFFANAGINGQIHHFAQRNDRINVYVHWNFIREFYLNHIPRDKEPQGFLGLFGQAGVPITNIIPDQHLLSVGMNYYFTDFPVNFGFEVKNLTNEKLYDYYKIQRPGRSFHFKLNFQISKHYK